MVRGVLALVACFVCFRHWRLMNDAFWCCVYIKILLCQQDNVVCNKDHSALPNTQNTWPAAVSAWLFLLQLWASRWNWSFFRRNSGQQADRYKCINTEPACEMQNNTNKLNIKTVTNVVYVCLCLNFEKIFHIWWNVHNNNLKLYTKGRRSVQLNWLSIRFPIPQVFKGFQWPKGIYVPNQPEYLLWHMQTSFFILQCAALDGKCSISCDDEVSLFSRSQSTLRESSDSLTHISLLQNINCYLIDNNGFILVAEDYTLVRHGWKSLFLSQLYISFSFHCNQKIESIVYLVISTSDVRPCSKNCCSKKLREHIMTASQQVGDTSGLSVCKEGSTTVYQFYLVWCKWKVFTDSGRGSLLRLISVNVSLSLFVAWDQ